jgi:hypothetical protein
VPEAILLQFWVAVGSIIGRCPYRTQGSRHHLNEFAVLVGETSRGRKGTSWRTIENLLECIDPEWLRDRVVNGIQSGEAIIFNVRDPRFGPRPKKQKSWSDGEANSANEIIDCGVTDKRLLLLEEEFARILEVSGRSGNTISPVLRVAFEDGTSLRNAGKDSPDKATEAHISLIGHITKPELHRCLGIVEHHNGFANRALWVASRRTKKIPVPKWFEWQTEHPEIIDRLTNVVAIFRQDSSTRRKLEFSRQGLTAWNQFYDSIDDQLGSIGAILARAETHVLRLAMIYTVLDNSTLIEPKHIAAARAVWDYCPASACWAFQNSTGNAIADKILWALLRESGGLSRDQIRSEVLWRHCSKTQLDEALSVLKQNRFADQKYQHGVKGRPTEIWSAIISPPGKPS